MKIILFFFSYIVYATYKMRYILVSNFLRLTVKFLRSIPWPCVDLKVIYIVELEPVPANTKFSVWSGKFARRVNCFFFVIFALITSTLCDEIIEKKYPPNRRASIVTQKRHEKKGKKNNERRYTKNRNRMAIRCKDAKIKAFKSSCRSKKE